MALGEPISLPFTHAGCVTNPVVLGSQWQMVVDNATVLQQTSTITDPSSNSQIPTGSYPIVRQSRARVLLTCLGKPEPAGMRAFGVQSAQGALDETEASRNGRGDPEAA